MKYPFVLLAVLALVGCVAQGLRYCPAGLPVYDHVVIVVEENKDYEQIIGNPAAPYLNRLAAEGALLTRMFGEEHNSEGNYFWLYSGSNHNVGFVDEVPNAKTHSDYPFKSSNLVQQLTATGKSFKGYSESLPRIGFVLDHQDGRALTAVAVGGTSMRHASSVPATAADGAP